LSDLEFVHYGFETKAKTGLIIYKNRWMLKEKENILQAPHVEIQSITIRVSSASYLEEKLHHINLKSNHY
jgi:hypothetical protein